MDTVGSSASVGNEDLDLPKVDPKIKKKKRKWPKFVAFNSLQNKNYLRPSGVHGYMKFEAVDAVRWGVKHEIHKSKRGQLVHIRCCDTGKYWTWGLTEDSHNFITAQADQPGEDETTEDFLISDWELQQANQPPEPFVGGEEGELQQANQPPEPFVGGEEGELQQANQPPEPFVGGEEGELQIANQPPEPFVGAEEGELQIANQPPEPFVGGEEGELQIANQPPEPFVGAENTDTEGFDASVGNEGLDLPKFVAFNALSKREYLRPEGEEGSIRFMAEEPVSWGVKHEIHKAESERGLVHIRCSDTGFYWAWVNGKMLAMVDQPDEDKTSSTCTLIKPSQYTKDGVSVINFQVWYRGIWWSVGGDDQGYLQTGGEDFIITNFESLQLQPVVNEETVLPKFVVFKSLSYRKYLRPGGVHRYMKFEVVEAVRWGVKHEVENAKYGQGLVHIRCCDTGKYWTWGLTEDSEYYITAQADQPSEDVTRRACTLIKPSQTTKGDVKVVNLQVMYEGEWKPVGVNKGGYLVNRGEEHFLVSDWESQQTNQSQGPFVGAENMDTAGYDASLENERLDLPKFVAINSLLNKKYLSNDKLPAPWGSYYVRFMAETPKNWGVKHEVQKAQCDDELVHIKCCDTGKYWGRSSGFFSPGDYVVADATHSEEDKNEATCTLIKPSQYTKDGVTVVNFQIMAKALFLNPTWWSIGGNAEGYLVNGGEDFIVSNWETLQMGLTRGPSGACVTDTITLKLCPTNYFMWKKQMLAFLATQDLRDFVDGTIKPLNMPPVLGEEANSAYTEWKERDGLVRGWILATLTENILRQVMHLGSAREVWIELRKIFTSTFQLSPFELIDLQDQKRGQMVSQYIELHKAALTAKWETAEKFLEQNPNAISQPITSSLETALIVSVRSPKRNDFVKKLIEKMENSPSSEEETERIGLEKEARLALKDMSGATALHAAADGGNIVAARLLVQKNPKLANMRDRQGTLAVHVAAGLGNREMVDFLLEHTTNLSENESGLKFLHFLASSGLYDVALTFIQQHTKLAGREPSPLEVIAQKRTSFRSGTSWNILQRLIYSGIPSKLEDIASNPQERHIEDNPQGNDIENPFKSAISALSYVRKKGNALFWDVAEKLESVLIPFNWRPIKSIRKTKTGHYQALNLVKCLCEEVVKNEPKNAAEIFTEPLKSATCMGIHEIVEEILQSYPSAMHLRSEENQSLFHLAVMYRHENVFNLIYQMEEDWRALLSVPDASKNNALHLAGNLGPQQQLILQASAAGAALQMQRELQWFKAVEKFILPQAKERTNKDGKTPQELFTMTHKDLVKEGEKWMKDTANSCSIVAALITTIVFAASITVPGGSNTDSGLPVKLGNHAFTLFLISDALAMFSSSASLLMFLSILTSRYAEQDFQYSLPRRMIIGLATLFLSIISMMVAFGATLKIVSGKTKPWIIICVAMLSCVPVTLFALLQFPLLLDMIKSTYYPSIRKQSNRILH